MIMCIFETTPCIYYLSDKNLEDEEYLKLFVLYGAVFDAPPDAVGDFTAYLENQDRVSPRAYQPDEIMQMKKKIVRPHAKRVNPYGCYDITRYGTFFNINVPKNICQGCPYSMTYKNGRRESEDIVLASILQNNTIPDRIRVQMELSGSKAAEGMMCSVSMVQGKEAHRSKYDMIGLNAFLLQYLYSNCNLSALEGMDNMAGYIKNKIKTYLLKNRELANSPDYVYEMLCREFVRISSMDVESVGGKDRLEKAVAEILMPYQYDRGRAIDAVKNRMGNRHPAAVEIHSFHNNVPFVIEPVEIPLVSEKVSIIDDSPVQDMEPQIFGSEEKKVKEETDQTSGGNGQEGFPDPERYYPENYRIDSGQDWGQINTVHDGQGFPFIKEVGDGYIIAAEKCSHSGKDGILFFAGDGKFYFYRLNRQSDNKAVRELIRRRPLIITMNSVELHALLKKYRLYEGRMADLKDMFAALNVKGALPHTYKALMEKMSGTDLCGGGDFYLSAMKHYRQVYLSYLEKIAEGRAGELFELYSCVSAAIGSSWDSDGVFKDVSMLYRRKSLFEYQSVCPENVIPDAEGSLYFYRTDDVPAKNERFYIGLVRELVRMESVKLGKVLVLRISDKGLGLFAFETNAATYELLQWPCVYLARELGIKDSHVHYRRQVFAIQGGDKKDMEEEKKDNEKRE